MRKLTLAASVAFAFAASGAMAQAAGGVAGGGTASAGSQTAQPAPSGTGFTNSTGVGGNSRPSNVTNADPSLSQPAPFAPGGSFSNDSGNSALGQSPGQTSAGTATGNSAPGLDVGSASLGTGTDLGGTTDANAGLGVGGTAGTGMPFGTAAVVPGGAGTDINGQRAGNPSENGGGFAQAQAPATAIATPMLDESVRRAQARMQRDRATGRTPRIIGIAPNTDRDLTDQMPDDRIIRY